MKKIDTSKLRKGDIILSTSAAKDSELIRFAIRSDISHAMLYVANGSVMDSTGEGVQARNIDKMFYDDSCALYAYRPIVELSEEAIDKVVEYVRAETGSPYTKKEAAASALPISRGGGKNQFCSRLVARAYASIGVNISENPDFANPADIQKSPLLQQIPDVVLNVSPEEEASGANMSDTTIGMRDKTNKLLAELRSIAPAIRVLSDVEPFLLQNPHYDKSFAKAYVDSGYLMHWKIEPDRFPWRYDAVAMVQFYQAVGDDGKDALLEYCRQTLQHDQKGDFRHWEVNAATLQKLTATMPLETFKLNLQLYHSLCSHHKLRVDCARMLLRVYGV